MNGGKKHSGSYAARTASLPDLWRWPGDGFFGQKSEVGNPTSLRDRSRNSDFGETIPTSQPLAKKACCSPPHGRTEFFFPGKNPDLGRAMPGRRGRWRARCGAVGRASTKGPLGEPVLRGRWASQLGEPVLSGQRLLGATVPRHIYLVPARHIYLVPARHVPARHIYLVPARARSALCQLGTFT